MKISILVPSRQRRNSLMQMYNSAMDMADNPRDVEVVVYADEDDTQYNDMGFLRMKVLRGPRIVLSEMWNACWKQAKGEYFLHAGDDLRFRSKGWDTEMTKAIDEYPKKIAVVWGDDWLDGTYRNESGTHCMVHKNWTDTVGYFVPPYFVSDYNDTFFNDLGEKLHVRKYLHHVKIEHLHFTLGKAEIDDNTRERLERHEKQHPDQIYKSDWFQAEIEQKREALQEFIHAT